MKESTKTAHVRTLHADDHEAVFDVARALAAWFTPIDQMMMGELWDLRSTRQPYVM